MNAFDDLLAFASFCFHLLAFAPINSCLAVHQHRPLANLHEKMEKENRPCLSTIAVKSMSKYICMLNKYNAISFVPPALGRTAA